MKKIEFRLSRFNCGFFECLMVYAFSVAYSFLEKNIINFYLKLSIILFLIVVFIIVMDWRINRWIHKKARLDIYIYEKRGKRKI